MKYLHLFDTKSEHNSFYVGNTYKEPWLAYIKDEGHMTYNKDYFTIEAIENGNVKIIIPADVSSSYATSISYSKDWYSWTDTIVDSTTQIITIPVIAGDKVYLKGIAKRWATSYQTYTLIYSTSNINVSGNVMSLLYGDDFVDKQSFPSGSAYTLCGLFKNNKHLIDASDLKLPATTLTSYCYSSMFDGCKSLNYIKAMFTTTPPGNYTSLWVRNVSSTGTFVKNNAATWSTNGGDSTIPKGWTVQTASA